ncbi:DUF4402 domain-containing protein [Pseudoalteromonas denitrificans]|uniref:DUF4402 domain-containing protein n=1 Tax=Pseudoalteromonas denitrificans TaxID=43656 RepID=UPI0015A5C736|nr:DUF4402 domain-containing protein [Pseudoalteromonas denitrificans]
MATSITGTLRVRTTEKIGTTELQSLSFGSIEKKLNGKCIIQITTHKKRTHSKSTKTNLNSCSADNLARPGIFTLKGLAKARVKIQLKNALTKGWKFEPYGITDKKIQKTNIKKIVTQFSNTGEATLYIGGKLTINAVSKVFHHNDYAEYTINIIY